MEALQLISDLGPGILKIGAGIVTLASIIVAVTKTPGKKKKIALIYKLIEILALNIGRAKDKPE